VVKPGVKNEEIDLRIIDEKVHFSGFRVLRTQGSSLAESFWTNLGTGPGVLPYPSSSVQDSIGSYLHDSSVTIVTTVTIGGSDETSSFDGR
jgi:hypothetical protein